ncbi:Ser/Thr protein phosphatase, putative [Trichomonas vaginalis G3]|uniref:Serine/threonine-protein phosphatase n=1 Tax=Trichomonas vaginalis (strain ATCC PRA-98 / G3) TaxID=412133 RepID=A2E4U4_TRIV3|nr:phosphoprotein phosphatase protein [Trichomonas vaginalis G3]EAY12283.1 Ser/Thr protein phosphatase, putative [Trichomonas vaginalis G3]KAI5552399.1 phosphoprotein phosphatase protein [Trichomonas vaginalis G3]|eukprot:XP_001324506.1 Ser/Thr protein phosphatase [Trichomonas vaginalis G3]
MNVQDSFEIKHWYIKKAQFNGDPIIEKLMCKDMTFQLELMPIDHDPAKPLQATLRLCGRVFGQRNIICNLNIHYPNKIRPFINIPICYCFITTDPIYTVKSKISFKTLERGGWFNKDTLHITVTLAPSPEMPKSIGQIKKPPNLNDIIRRILSPHDVKCSSLLEKADINWLCAASSSLLLSQPTLLRVKAPILCVADLHGRYIDLLRIFKKYGFPDKVNYLFLGDYVDRGEDSLDIITLLLALKLRFPENLYMLRGNHECELISSQYGFKDECRRKGAPYQPFMLPFDSLPLAAIINDKVFCVHGGPSPSMTSLDDIQNFPRPRELPKEGIINDLTWADPSSKVQFYGPTIRNTSVSYGREAAKSFMETFGFEMILRAHEVVPNGYKFPFGEDMNVVTLFSAPNYYDENLGATMVFDENLRYAIDSFKDSTKSEAAEIMATDFNDQIQL